MARLRYRLLAVGLTLGSGAGAVAAPSTVAATVAGWTVAPAEDRAGCFVTRTFDRSGDTTVLLGLDRDGTNRLSVLNANWSIRARERVKLTFRLSKAAYPRHAAIGIAADGKQGFVTTFGKDFPAQFAATRTLDIARGDVPVERLALDGSGAAVAALRRCVAALGSGRGAERPRDGAIPRDPFAVPAGRESRR